MQRYSYRYTPNEIIEMEEKFRDYIEIMDHIILAINNNNINCEEEIEITDLPLELQFENLEPLNTIYKKCNKCFRVRSISEYKNHKKDIYKVCNFCLKKRKEFILNRKSFKSIYK